MKLKKKYSKYNSGVVSDCEYEFEYSDNLNDTEIKRVESMSGDEAVLLNLNPKKFEKGKDNLFFDFFSIYTKNFIKNGNGKVKNENIEVIEE